jgi:hypothetical protein
MDASDGTVVTRPWSPRLIRRSPSRISRPTFRLGAAIDLLLDLLQAEGHWVRAAGTPARTPEALERQTQWINKLRGEVSDKWYG